MIFLQGQSLGVLFCFEINLPFPTSPRLLTGIWPARLLLQARVLSHTLAPADFKEAQWQKKHPRFKTKTKQKTNLLTVELDSRKEDQVQLTVNLAASRE